MDKINLKDMKSLQTTHYSLLPILISGANQSAIICDYYIDLNLQAPL